MPTYILSFGLGNEKTTCLVHNLRMYNNTGHDSGFRNITITRKQKCGENWRTKFTIDQSGP